MIRTGHVKFRSVCERGERERGVGYEALWNGREAEIEYDEDKLCCCAVWWVTGVPAMAVGVGQ